MNGQYIQLLGSDSSLTNIFVEIYTVIMELKSSIFSLLFGKGLGAGISDITGFLTPLAGFGGYNEIDALRNNFFKMHLPFTDILLKGGILFMLTYLYFLISFFKNNKIYGFIAFSLFFSVFTFTKESVLLSILIIEIVNSYQDKSTNINATKSII